MPEQTTSAMHASRTPLSRTESAVNCRQSAFSLIELLIAMTLGLILIAGMITVLEGNRRSSELNSTMADLQESARFALDAIARDARMSGFQGCTDINNSRLNVVAKNLPASFDFNSQATFGSLVSSDTWNPAHPLGFTPPSDIPVVAGTHAMILQFGEGNFARLDSQMSDAGVPSKSGPIVVSGQTSLQADDLAIIADCDVADLFRVTAASNSGGNTTLSHAASGNNGNLSKAFGAPASIAQTTVSAFQSNTYYIGDAGQTNDNGDPIRALYLQTLPYTSANPPVELIRGVDNMRVAFGMRSGNTLRYVTPDNSAFDASLVESVQIGLLMSSRERISDRNDTKTYMLAGQRIGPQEGSDNGTQHPGDQRFRLAFNTTIKVRNRRALIQ